MKIIREAIAILGITTATIGFTFCVHAQTPTNAVDSGNTTTETLESSTSDNQNSEDVKATDSSSVAPVGTTVDIPLTTPSY